MTAVRPARLHRLPRMFLRIAPPRRLPLLALIGLLALPGCDQVQTALSHPIQARGNRVDPDQLSQLVPGTATRADAIAVLGSPTARATFDDNTWLYISQMTKPVIAATNSIREQQVVALVFDGGGVLREVKQRGQDDSLPVQIVSRTTPTPGNDSSFVQQLLGNVGKFTPGQMSRSSSNY